MDPDALQEEVETWVRDGLITESQAAAILERYEDTDDSRSRAVLALSVVGAALLFAGVTLFLTTNWDRLPTVGQVAVLLAVPTSAYGTGVVAYRRTVPRIGLACCLLGALLAGPSLFLLSDLAATRIDESWLLLSWAAIAFPTGHTLESRVGVWIGTGILTALVVELAGAADPVVPVALLGIVLFVIGRLRGDRIGWGYRIGGATLTLFSLVLLTADSGGYARFDIGPTAVFAATLLAGIVGVSTLTYRRDRLGSGWAAVSTVGVATAASFALLTPNQVPQLVGFVGVHVATLAVVAATGCVGYRSGSQRFVDLATLGALAQTLSFVASTVINALSGSLALIVSGVVLLSVGVALERGRRRLLGRSTD